MAGRVVIAIGGNSLIKDPHHITVEDQHEAAAETDDHIAQLVAEGWEVCITHGNGPQVGFILRRSELASHELHEVPLWVCGADTQGAIGFSLQQNLCNDFRRLGIDKTPVTVVTQVEVDPEDPAFAHPSKPIGSFLAEADAAAKRDELGWHVVEDAGRGWRRVVASPHPKRIVELEAIETLLDAGMVVIAVGGGGIPVVTDRNGDLQGVAAVIDKDRASALLASLIRADVFLISTGVEQVALDWGKPEQRFVDRMTVDEARGYLAAGTHFARGSMAPKIEAAIDYIDATGGQVVITNPGNLERALAGETGTRIGPS